MSNKEYPFVYTLGNGTPMSRAFFGLFVATLPVYPGVAEPHENVVDILSQYNGKVVGYSVGSSCLAFETEEDASAFLMKYGT